MERQKLVFDELIDQRLSQVINKKKKLILITIDFFFEMIGFSNDY